MEVVWTLQKIRYYHSDKKHYTIEYDIFLLFNNNKTHEKIRYPKRYMDINIKINKMYKIKI